MSPPPTPTPIAIATSLLLMSTIASLTASLSEVSNDGEVEAVTVEPSEEFVVDVPGWTVGPNVLGFVGPTIVGAIGTEIPGDRENVVVVPMGTTWGGTVPIENGVGGGVTKTAVVQLKRQQKFGMQLFRQLVSFSAMTTQTSGNWPGPVSNCGAEPVSRLKETLNTTSDVR